jgi:transcription elongation GreA/GreB family factor
MAAAARHGQAWAMEPVESMPAAPPRPEEPEVLLTAAEHAARHAELRLLLRRREIAGPEDEQAVLELRIARLEQLLADAAIVDDAQGAGVVAVGSVVDVDYVRLGRTATYRVTVADAGPGRVSARSPVGRALMGRRAGDVVTAELPRGRRERLRVARVAPDDALRAAG